MTRQVTVVTGPPGSGKSTYVKAHAQPGDVTIDYDELAVTLGSRHHHDHNHAIRWLTYGVWKAAVTALLTGTDLGGWIVHAYPDINQANRYWRAGARVVAVDPDTRTVTELDPAAYPYRPTALTLPAEVPPYGP